MTMYHCLSYRLKIKYLFLVLDNYLYVYVLMFVS